MSGRLLQVLLYTKRISLKKITNLPVPDKFY